MFGPDARRPWLNKGSDQLKKLLRHRIVRVGVGGGCHSNKGAQVRLQRGEGSARREVCKGQRKHVHRSQQQALALGMSQQRHSTGKRTART